MISVPWYERVIYLRYDIALSCDDICLRHMRNGYYIMLAKQVYHTACRISYRVSDISLKNTTNYDIVSMKEGERMKDKRINKVKQHFDMFFNNQKFKIISYKIDEADSILFIKTKIFGQDFPHNGRFTIVIPSQNTMQDLSVVFRSMSKDSSIEHWEYTIKAE